MSSTQTVSLRHALRGAAAALLVTLLGALLAGCTVTLVGPSGPGSTVPARANPVIERFEVQGGEGTTYRVGQQIGFQIRTRVDGYVTLTSLAPDGEVHVFARNLYVQARRTNVLDGRDQGVVFVVERPRGWHKVRASFTPDRTDVSRVRFVGRLGEDQWHSAIQIDIEPFEVRDVAETRFFVR